MEVDKLRTIDVDAPKLETRGRPLVEATMKGHEQRLPGPVDRPVNERDKVKVADARRVVSCRHRTPDEEIGDPAERREPAPQLHYGRRQNGLS